MTKYLEVLGGCFPGGEAYVPTGGDQTVYDDLVWITTPIPQATLDASPCNTELPPIPEEVEVASTSSLAAGVVGKILQLDFENPSSIGGDWLQSGGMPTNETPVIVPLNCKLVSLTFSNKERNADTELQIQAVSETDGKSPSPIIYTWILDNVRTARKNDFSSDVTFTKGDKIAVYAKQRGNKDPSQVKMTIHLLVLESDDTEYISNWSGNIS